jgi:hypothetical protein
MAGFGTRDSETTESVSLGETSGTSIRRSRQPSWREPTFCSPRMTKWLADNYVWQEDLAPSGACRLVVAIMSKCIRHTLQDPRLTLTRRSDYYSSSPEHARPTWGRHEIVGTSAESVTPRICESAHLRRAAAVRLAPVVLIPPPRGLHRGDEGPLNPLSER